MTCVVIILERNLQFHCFDSCSDEFNDLRLITYKRLFSESDNGFYDWLRDASGTLIGVRWFPYDESIIGSLRNIGELEFVESSSDCLELKIFFSKNRAIDEARSCDQDFLENYVYYCSDGGCAISFSTKGLTPLELSKLCSSQ